MPITAMPAIDQAAAHSWNTHQQNLYASLSYYLAKMQVDRMKTFTTWPKVTGKIRWKPNMSDTMRAVRANPSPHIRQFAYPQKLSGLPNKDVMDVREVSVDANVYRHRFESPALHFVPSFQDFLDHVDDTGKDIMEKIERFNDIYIRSMIFQMTPYVFVSTGTGVSLVDAPFWVGTGNFTSGQADSKTTAFLQAQAAAATGNLTLAACNHALTKMEVDQRIPFFSGSNATAKDAPLSGKYCLICDSEAYNQFTFDPYLQQNKNCDLDVVNGSFRGSLFGRITTQLEDLPLRMSADGVFAAPELRQESTDAYNTGESLPNPAYTDLAQSQYGIAFMCGGSGYDAIEVGPPPSKFTGDSPPHDFPSLFWNGEVKATKQRLISMLDSDGNQQWEMNTYGEYLWWISQATFGVLPKQRRNIIPIIYKRKQIA